MDAFLQSFLKGETQIPTDEAFQASVHHYNDVFLRSERIAQIVVGGGVSQHDCREIFRYGECMSSKLKLSNVDLKRPFFRLVRRQIDKRIRTLPEIDGLSKETVVTSWMAKYDAIMKGEQHCARLLGEYVYYY